VASMGIPVDLSGSINFNFFEGAIQKVQYRRQVTCNRVTSKRGRGRDARRICI